MKRLISAGPCNISPTPTS
uniref:Uncharacterized protein n=1 Tax=Rhizophora mucronata TaxID=61149 RepID=A0A2P2N1T8_RHIMU